MVPFYFLVTPPSTSHNINCVLCVCTWHSPIALHTCLSKCASSYTEIVWVPHHHSTYGKLEKLSHDANLAFSKTVSEIVQQLEAFLCLHSVFQSIADIVSEVWTTLYYSTLYQCVSFYLKLSGQYIIVIIIRYITSTNQSKVFENFHKCFLYIL